MAFKNPEQTVGYMDNIPVKISEKYKPPKRILLPTNNTRLTVNDINQINYDFQLEQSVKERMKDLKLARNQIRNKRESDNTELLNNHQDFKENDILVPTTTTILTTTISSLQQEHEQQQNNNDLNISDFENDTCSPFDNMELKTINVLAELAECLQQQPQQVPLYNTYYELQETQKTSAIPAAADTTIPDIINAMQMDLKLNENRNDVIVLNNEAKNKKERKKQDKSCQQEETQNNPYAGLNQKMQAMVREVSLMGFPLDRVARVSIKIGEDQPKLIEHMIAMSQLLDLGFDEEEVMNALLRAENDRDKALDYLIS